MALRAQGDLARAASHLGAAITAKPDFIEALILLANVHEAQRRFDDAAACLRDALARRPDHAGAHNNLGIVLQVQGKLDEAIACYRNATLHQPDYIDAHDNLATALQTQGKFDEARASLRRIIALDPDSAAAHFHLANLLKSQQDYDAAIDAYRKAISLKPDFVEAHYNLGNLFQTQGDLEAAVACQRAALALQPEHAEAHNNLGIVLQMQGKLDEALACYRKALALRPNFAGAQCNLGSAFQAMRRFEEAISCYQKALELQPDLVDALYNLGNLHHLDEALPYYRQALALRPDYAQARWGIALSQQGHLAPKPDSLDSSPSEFGRALDELDAWFDGARIQEGVLAVGSLQPFFVAYRETNNRDVLAKYGKLCARLMRHWQESQGLAPGRQTPGKILRVGIVSAHIRDQSVWNAIVRGWFQHLDPARFSLHVFHMGTESDGETAFAQSRATYFEQRARGLRQWVEAILGQQLDVIIYPEIGMDPMTVKLACLRLAPVQVTTWGHPETTGLPTIDYYLSAEDLEPVDAQACYTERLVALPHLGCCYQSLSVTPVPADLEALGIRPDRPLLLCPGTPFKYTPGYDSVLVAIAQALGQCQFIFSTHHQDMLATRLRIRLESAFADAGLAFQDFAVFLPWQQRPAFYGLMQRADVYLDTIGFSGFNTAMQAIECGLPIVTREGRFLRGRLASGILKRMGLSELVVASEEDYVKLAVRLVRDVPYRQQLRERIVASRHILFDDLAPIRALEEFLINASGPH